MSQTPYGSMNALAVDRTITDDFQLQMNPLYDYPADRTIRALGSCPLASSVRSIRQSHADASGIKFATPIGREQFIGTDLKCYIDIPLVITLKTPTTNDITEADLLKTEVFNANTQIALAEGALTRLLNSYEVRLNKNTLRNISDIPLLSAAINPYYSVDEVSEFYQASEPDRFTDFGDYATTLLGNPQSYHDGRGNKVHTSINPLNEQNIFDSNYQRGINTRSPQWIWNGTGRPSKDKVYVKCRFWTYLPFTIGSLPNQQSSIAGVEYLELDLNFKPNVARLFSVQELSGSIPFSNIEIDGAKPIEGNLVYSLYSPPQYVLERMKQPNGLMKPYRVNIPLITPNRFNTTEITAGGTAQINQDSLLLSKVPRAIYVMAMQEDKSSFEDIVKTPLTYGLIESMEVRFNNHPTLFPNHDIISQICDQNGYDQMDVIGRLIKGFPVKLLLGKDITLGSDTVVGAEGSYNLAVSINVRNQTKALARYSLVVVVVDDATLEFSGSDFRTSTGVTVPSALLSDSRFLFRELYYKNVSSIEVIGAGKFGDAMRWLGRNAVSLAKNLWNNREEIGRVVGDVSGLIKAVRGGAMPQYSNSTSGGATQTSTLGAGSVHKSVFK